MKRPARFILPVLTFVVLASFMLGRGSSESARDDRPRTILPPTRLAKSYGNLYVPPSDSQPVISAEQAELIAENDRPQGDDPLTIFETYAILDDGYDPSTIDLAPAGGVPVWVVTFDGGCLEPQGGAVGQGDSPVACVPVEWNVVVNAKDGSFIQGYTSSGSAAQE